MKDERDFTLSEPDRSGRLLSGIHREYILIAKNAALLFGAGGLIFALASGALTAAVMYAAPLWILVPLGVAFVAAVAVAVTFLNMLDLARYALDAIVAEWRANQDTAREIARERVAIETSIIVRGNNNTVALSQPVTNQANQDNKQLVFVQAPQSKIEGIAVKDWVYFLERIVTQVGHTKRAWLGTVMPSGWKVAEYTDYARLIEPLERAGFLVDRGARSAGRLTTNDANALKAALGIPLDDAAAVVDVTPANQLTTTPQDEGA